MNVPRLLVVTDRHGATNVGRDLVTTVAAAVDAGAPAVLFRDKDLAADERRALGHAVAPVVRAAGATLIVASDAGLARELGADGVHLASSDAGLARELGADGVHLASSAAVPPTRWDRLVGRSCHDRREVVAAGGERVDYVTVSPVAASRSKPGYGPPLRDDELARLVALSLAPVLALGGVGAANVEPLLHTGIHGVAVMGGVMAAPDPASVVQDLLRTLQRGAHDPAR